VVNADFSCQKLHFHQKESAGSRLKELVKGFGNTGKNSREQTGICIAGKRKSGEEEQETAVGVLTFSSRHTNKAKFSSVLKQRTRSKITED